MTLQRYWHSLTLAVLTGWLSLMGGVNAAAAAPPALTTLRVLAHPAVPELQCASLPKGAAPAAAMVQDPREIPDDDEVQAALQQAGEARMPAAAGRQTAGSLGRARPGEPYRVAIWGDSHLAAGFFTQELVKILNLPPAQVRAAFLPASMNRPGVRLPLRQTCISPQWRYEPAHANAASAAAPGPGLVSLFSTQAGATLAWDLRHPAGLAESRQVRLLYQQTASPVRLAVSVDGGAEVELELSGAAGPAALELAADGPLSLVQVRLIAGELRVQGLALPVPSQTALQIDVFGYPGATVAGWKQAATDYLSAWFTQTPYNLVMMEYGTNEGNVKPFDASAYQATLRESVQRLRAVFPQAACVLITPGDRGVLVRRSEKWKRMPASSQGVSDKKSKKTGKKAGKESTTGAASKAGLHKAKRTPVAPVTERSPAPETGPGPARNLLQYTRIHEEIGQIQEAVAQQHGCAVWSMLQAMGGQGGAYRWARQSPPLMARDLIHFTVPGYQQLANQFAQDMGWDAKALGLTPP